MASREEEKRERREARLAAEREEAARAARSRRVRLGGGLALLVLIAVGVVVAIAAGGGGGGGPKGGGGNGVKLPAQKITDLKAAAAAAGCTLADYPKDYDINRNHLPDTTKIKYKTNPPAFGNHYEIPAQDGDYVGVKTPATGNLVHALEHGRIEVQYRSGLPRPEVKQLEALFDEKSDLMLVFQNETGMKDDVAVVAWTHILRCPKFTPKLFDAARAFRDKYKLKAPEVIPQAE